MTKIRPLISVIVPVYGAEAFLDRCVASVLAQDFKDFELLLVDDGSPDRCGDICEGWANRDPRVRTFHKDNGGQSSARNYGLDHARGKYVAFVDSDDWVTPDYLSYLLGLFSMDDNRKTCMFTACNHTIVRNGRSVKACDIRVPTVALSRRAAFGDVLFHGCIDVSPWAKLYRREVFDALRFPEGRLFEDTWLFGDMLNRTEMVRYGSKACYFYEMHVESTVNRSFREKNLEYIEAAEKLAAEAVACDPDNAIGAIRRINHARLSVLRYMEQCDDRYRELRQDLRSKVLKDAPKYIGDSRTPRRDKLAVMLLKLGLKPFYFGWNLYGKMR